MSVSDRPQGITCADWEPSAPGAKRCRHYSTSEAKGLCALASHPVCIEWLKKKHPDAPEVIEELRRAKREGLQGREAPSMARHGDVEPARPAAPPRAVPLPGGDLAMLGFRPAKDIDPDRIQELREAVSEIALAVPDAPEVIYLVAKRTGKPRAEITFESAATIRLIVDCFPGAHVVGFVPAVESSVAPSGASPPLSATSIRPDPFDLDD